MPSLKTLVFYMKSMKNGITIYVLVLLEMKWKYKKAADCHFTASYDPWKKNEM